MHPGFFVEWKLGTKRFISSYMLMRMQHPSIQIPAVVYLEYWYKAMTYNPHTLTQVVHTFYEQ